MYMPSLPPDACLNIAVVGSGISGLSAAWLLSQRHRVSVFEAGARLGGHSHTVDWNGRPVDAGFIVYNEAAYPNLTAMFRHLDIETEASDMSFAVSKDGGRLEYSGVGLAGLFAQRRNILNLRHWSMLLGILSFFRRAARDDLRLDGVTLDQYLDARGFGRALREDFLYPMAAAIWSTPAAEVGGYPAASFIRFFRNHGLLQATGQPIWRTVTGGAQRYVEKLARELSGEVYLNRAVRSIERRDDGVTVTDATGASQRFDAVVVGAHADQALRMLADPSGEERRVLGAFRYGPNHAVMHTDPSHMPRRRAAWASWNYMTRKDGGSQRLSVTYWMNQLQNIHDRPPVFVTLNPLGEIARDSIIYDISFDHPLFDAEAVRTQRRLWSLQGVRRTWFCGAYFGHGFHEDGLQAGLAVAERLGGVRRPWTVAGESDRVCLPEPSSEWALA